MIVNSIFVFKGRSTRLQRVYDATTLSTSGNLVRTLAGTDVFVAIVAVKKAASQKTAELRKTV